MATATTNVDDDEKKHRNKIKIKVVYNSITNKSHFVALFSLAVSCRVSNKIFDVILHTVL